MSAIDASAGLRFSLLLFKQYRQSGILTAKLPYAPGMREVCTASLRLVNGDVVSSFLENNTKIKKISVDQETLCRFDDDKGPFHWQLLPAEKLPAPQSEVAPVPVPKVIAEIQLYMVSGWSLQQKQILQHVYGLIDGVRNIEQIKATAQVAPNIVEEIINILVQWQVVKKSETR